MSDPQRQPQVKEVPFKGLPLLQSPAYNKDGAVLAGRTRSVEPAWSAAATRDNDRRTTHS